MLVARMVGLTIISLWFFIGGIAHFAATETAMRIVPTYVPCPWAAVIVSGVLELLGAAGILWRPTRRTAGLGLMATSEALSAIDRVAVGVSSGLRLGHLRVQKAQAFDRAVLLGLLHL